eukprot:s2022_g10.t1
MYSFECYESGRAKEADQRMDLERGTKKLTAAEHDAVSNVLCNFDWTKFGQESQPEAAASSQSSLAITNGPQVVLWKNVELKLTQAKAAHDRVLGSLNKMFAAVSHAKDPDLSLKFKTALTTLQKNSQDISNALMFQDCSLKHLPAFPFAHLFPISSLQEIPGCKSLVKTEVDEWLFAKGKDMKIHYEASDELKGVLKARELM